jgi:hypothetical protein
MPGKQYVTQRALGEMLGVQQGQISKWQTQDGMPRDLAGALAWAKARGLGAASGKPATALVDERAQRRHEAAEARRRGEAAAEAVKARRLLASVEELFAELGRKTLAHAGIIVLHDAGNRERTVVSCTGEGVAFEAVTNYVGCIEGAMKAIATYADSQGNPAKKWSSPLSQATNFDSAARDTLIELESRGFASWIVVLERGGNIVHVGCGIRAMGDELAKRLAFACVARCRHDAGGHEYYRYSRHPDPADWWKPREL